MRLFASLFFAALVVALPQIPYSESGNIARTTDSNITARADTNNAANLPWAAIGDSWASGVRYGNLAYKDGTCLRIKDAYSVQLSEDNTWTDANQQFKFVACSGSRIGAAKGQAIDMSTDDSGNKVQRKFATMTLGGNDAGFYQVAVDCFYQYNPDPNAYGPPYPDPESACTKSLQQVRQNIADAPNKVNIYAAIDSIMDQQRNEQGNKDFDLYVTGYAHFFNVDDDSTWCNDQSFGLLPLIHKPLLSLQLRREVNDLTQRLNDLYRQAVAGKNDPRIHFVDISPNFDKNRWCEPDQKDPADIFNYDGTKSWFFNFQIPKDVPIPCVNTLGKSGSTFPLLDFDVPWDKIDSLIPDCLKNYLESGEFLRPFHPIRQGHDAIKRHIKDAIGAKYATAGSTTGPPCTHAADPDGAMGLCPSLANGGWCDCGKAGTFTMMSGSNICGYTTTPPSSATAPLTKCSSTTTAPTTTTSSSSTSTSSTPSCPTGGSVSCDKCPSGFHNCANIGYTGAEAICNCNDPCGGVVCHNDAL